MRSINAALVLVSLILSSLIGTTTLAQPDVSKKKIIIARLPQMKDSLQGRQGESFGEYANKLIEPDRQATKQRGSDFMEISQQWAKHWNAKNVDALVALYAEEAVFLPSNGSRVTGRVAIRDLFEKALAINTPDLHLHSKATRQSADLAYDNGEYEETITSAGVKRAGHGSYLVVLKRDTSGQWRIVAHMWTYSSAQ